MRYGDAPRAAQNMMFRDPAEQSGSEPPVLRLFDLSLATHAGEKGRLRPPFSSLALMYQFPSWRPGKTRQLTAPIDLATTGLATARL